MISILLLILPATVATSGTEVDLTSPLPEEMDLRTGRTCNDYIDHYFPDPDRYLQGVAEEESKRVVEDRMFSCHSKYDYQYDPRVKVVCKRLFNSVDSASTNVKLCDLFLTDETPRTRYNVHSKITVQNFGKYGCAFYHQEGISAIACAFLR